MLRSLSVKARMVIIVTIIVAVTLWAWRFSSVFKPQPQKAKAVAVTVVKAAQKPMPLTLQMIGTIEAQRSVSVRPQITGMIKKIAFTVGQDVTENQLLFEIEPAPFLASLRQAQAKLKQDQAQLVVAEANVKRLVPLIKPGYVSTQDYEQALAVAKAQAALVAADRAQVQQAEIQLGYTKIQAPVAGKTGNVTIKEGDLVSNNSQDSLVTINQLDSVWVSFSIPQRDLPSLFKYQAKGPLTATICTEDGTKELGHGRLVFVDNTVNAQTGTVLLKASIDNAKHLLWPGLMVSVKLVLAVEPQSIVVPNRAVQLDQQGSFVYRVKEGKAVAQPVKVDRQVGGLSIISQGLAVGETVITTVPPELTEGSAVQVVA